MMLASEIEKVKVYEEISTDHRRAHQNGTRLQRKTRYSRHQDPIVLVRNDDKEKYNHPDYTVSSNGKDIGVA
jgi:hypothetical protein